jgi:glycosyltransferase involved in cell wall biosynthesis
MRVAVVVRSLNMGGMQRSAVSLAESFAQEGHESHLIYFKEKNRVFTPEASVILHHFNLQKLSLLSVIGVFSELFSRLLNIFIRNSYFLWSAPFLSFLFRYRLALLEKQYGQFDLIIIRGQGTFETLWPIKDPRYFQITESMFIPSNTPLKRFYFKFLYHQKNVICVSRAIQEKLLAIYKQTRTSPNLLNVIGNPLKVEDIRKKAEAFTPEINESYILSVGRVTPNKNISLLIDAYTLLRSQEKITQKLVIIGTGHDLENVRRRAEESPYKESIFLMGQISNPYPWMKHADLFVLSSKLEGLGMVLLEALACGTKVVSTKSQSGIMDIMQGDLARYLCEQNPPSMAELIDMTLHEENMLDFESCIAPFLPQTIVHDFECLLSDSQPVT